MKMEVVSFQALYLCLLFVACSKHPAAIKIDGLDSRAERLTWRNLGPGGGGTVYCPTVNPHDPQNVLVACDMTGAYATFDGGNSWHNFNLRSGINDFAFDPNNENTVYAANSALYRSEDKGRTWQLIYPDPQNVVSEVMQGDEADQRYITADGRPDGNIVKIRVDPSDSRHIWIVLEPPKHFTNTAPPSFTNSLTRILVSNDRGSSWRLLATLPARRALALLPGIWLGKPGVITFFSESAGFRIAEKTGVVEQLPLPQVERILSADGGYSKEQGAILYILASMKAANRGEVSGGIYRSVDGGESWVQINNGLLGDWTITGELPVFKILAVCAGSPRVAYLSCWSYPAAAGGSTQQHFGTFKTEDGGASWRWSYRGSERGVLTENYTGYWKDRSYGIAWGGAPYGYGICPTRPEVCFLTDNRTLRTTDGGAHWVQVGSIDLPDGSSTTRGIEGTTTYGVHFDPFDRNHFLITYADWGLLQTFNGGKGWLHAIKGIPLEWNNTCYWVEIDPEVRGRIYAAWSGAHDLPRSKWFYSDKLGLYQGGAAVSEDGGRKWRVSNRGMPDNTLATHIILDPDTPASSRTLYVCAFGRGVFKSTDGAMSWRESSKGIGANRNCWRIARLPSGKLFLLVSRDIRGGRVVDGALYSSSDKAESWQRESLPQGVIAPNDLICDPSNPERMYLSSWPFIQEDREVGGGLWRTEDGGQTWRGIFNEQAHVFAAALDPRRPSTIYVSTFDSAAWRSDDRGGTWHRIKGYNFKWGHRPVPDPYDPDMLYLTTFGGSVFHGPANGAPNAIEDILNFKEAWRLQP